MAKPAFDGNFVALVRAMEAARRQLESLPDDHAWTQEELENLEDLRHAAIGPEKGGACRCWASPRGGWSYIKKVNKVSVTVEDNWGNGGKNFTRTIPFDKLSALMTAAEVQAARDSGRLVECSTGEGFGLLDEPAKPAMVILGSGENAEVARKDLLDSIPDAVVFEAMAETLKAGVKVVTAPNLFPTPPAIARQVVELASIRDGMRILEPSAGTGALLDTCLPAHTMIGGGTAVEVNVDLANALTQKCSRLWSVVCADFLECLPEPTDLDDETDGRPCLGRFDRVVMNPPFDHGSDIRHIEHAMTFLRPGGRLVAVCANGPRQREALEPKATAWIDLPAGSFQGTGVNAAIVVIDT